MPKYELIPHTADMGIRVTGKDLPETFQKAGFALFDIMTDIKEVNPAVKETVKVTADNLDELMNYWLTSLLQQFTLKNRLISKVKINNISPPLAPPKASLAFGGETALEAVIQGEPYNPSRHQIHKEIKAITFHNLSVRKTSNGWQAEVIFDV